MTRGTGVRTPAPERRSLGRRAFLVRAGVIGAVAATGRLALGTPRGAAQSVEDVLGALVPALRGLAHDTISGLAAFVVPGPDAYSAAQGVTTPEPGGIAADATGFLVHALDNFFPLPDEAVRPLAAALATGAAGGAGPSPLDPVLDPGADAAARLDAALADLLQSDGTVPLSLVAALLLNLVASTVDAGAVAGRFPSSPFASLPYAGKVEVFRRLEEDAAGVAAAVDGSLPEPLRRSLAGLLAFVAGALLEFAAFGSYAEWSAFDRGTRRLTGVPVGWRLTGYLATTGFRPVEGWDELLGYYQGRTEVDG